MRHYRATNLSTLEVVEYDADLPQAEHLGEGWNLESISDAYAAAPDPEAPPDTRLFGGRRRVTKLEFVQLLGGQQYGAILAMAKQSIGIEAWVKLLELATPESDGTSINLDDPRTQGGVQAIGQALQQAQAVEDGSAWAAGVLNG